MAGINERLAGIFNQIANAIETGQYGEKIKVGITTLGSEHGVFEVIRGAEIAAKRNKDIEVFLIGPQVKTELPIICKTDCEKTAHEHMEDLLENGVLDACVTMHYNFPIGVSTVGRVLTPGLGRELIIATTTGTSGTHRVSSMLRNVLHGVVTARTLGIKTPTVGILNVDGARQVEKALKELVERGYGINFAESVRADGGCLMRGNDLLQATADVIVTDTLTGNLLIKIFSSFTTGGSYEGLGYGYGPGVGENYDKIINIISRASGAPVIAGAIRYAADAARGKLIDVTKEEYQTAKRAGLDEVIASLEEISGEDTKDKVTAPSAKPVTEEIVGIDILVLEDAVQSLWRNNIYAESGMGCAGPVVLISPEDGQAALKILETNGFIA